MPPRAAFPHPARSDLTAGCLLSLPPDVVRELRQVTAAMRDMPRACATDRAELVFWLSRLARTIDRIVDSKVSVPRPLPPRPVAIVPPTAPAAALPRIVVAKEPTLPPVEAARAAQRRQSPAFRWRATPIDKASRRQAEAAGQGRLFD